MRGLLVRVGIDQTYGGWNAPCRADGSFCYIPMQPIVPERFDDGLQTTYHEFEAAYDRFANGNGHFPDWLHNRPCHLDPDFRYLTYGDSGQRAIRISSFFKDSVDNFIAFYASFRPIDGYQQPLVYGIIGLYRFQMVGLAHQVTPDQRSRNAHTRLAGYQHGTDVVIFAEQNTSGRLRHLLPIGERQDNGHYYVLSHLFDAWGGISSRNGWIQRSVYLPDFCKPERFLQWFTEQNVELIAENNITYP